MSPDGRDRPVAATLGTTTLSCLMCGHAQFWNREIKLNSTGAEFFSVGWANASALGLICAKCGFVHSFVNDQIQLCEPSGE